MSGMTFEERVAHVLVTIWKDKSLEYYYGSEKDINDWREAFEYGLDNDLIGRDAWRYYVTPAGEDYIEGGVKR